MTEAEAARVALYFRALGPHVRQLREQGFPVEVMVELGEAGQPVVRASWSADDCRVPAEAKS